VSAVLVEAVVAAKVVVAGEKQKIKINIYFVNFNKIKMN
jgi:hypothetical protein